MSYIQIQKVDYVVTIMEAVYRMEVMSSELILSGTSELFRQGGGRKSANQALRCFPFSSCP